VTAATGTPTKPGAAADDADKNPTPPAKRARGETLFFALRSKKFLVSATILLVLAFIAIFGPLIDSTDPVAQGGCRCAIPLWSWATGSVRRTSATTSSLSSPTVCAPHSSWASWAAGWRP